MDHEQRLTELEVKLAFQDDLLETLNNTVSRQQRELELLQQQLRLLYQQQLQIQPPSSGGLDARHEIPPHY